MASQLSVLGHVFQKNSCQFLSKVKNREEFERGLEKGKENGGKEEKKEKSDKTHVKIPF